MSASSVQELVRKGKTNVVQCIRYGINMLQVSYRICVFAGYRLHTFSSTSAVVWASLTVTQTAG